MKKAEVTSARVARIAGKVLEKLRAAADASDRISKLRPVASDSMLTVNFFSVCTVAELKALAASCLTQTKDKPKKSKTRGK